MSGTAADVSDTSDSIEMPGSARPNGQSHSGPTIVTNLNRSPTLPSNLDGHSSVESLKSQTNSNPNSNSNSNSNFDAQPSHRHDSPTVVTRTSASRSAANGSGSGSGSAEVKTHSAIGTTTKASASPVSGEGTSSTDVKCGGCKNSIDRTAGGVVVRFGNTLWHVDCFRCAKCNNQVTADTDLVLLSDGSPVCGNCSYQCNSCKLPINEEAIMTGDDCYHARCFTCRACNKRIEEIVFAKTSQGIYCMACYNERVARSRRHAEAKKRAKEKERSKQQHQQRKAEASTVATTGLPSTQSSTKLLLNNDVQGADVPESDSYAQLPNSPSYSSAFISPSPSMGFGSSTVASPAGTPAIANFQSKVQPSPLRSSAALDRRRSNLNLASDAMTLQNPQRTTNGFEPLNASSSGPADRNDAHLGLGMDLDVLPTRTTSKADKRRSINPAMLFGQVEAFPRKDEAVDVFSRGPITAGNPLVRSVNAQSLSPSQSSFPTNVQPLKLSRSTHTALDKEEGTWVASNRRTAAMPSDNPTVNASPPQADAPALPSLDFSLGDSDFAVLLAENMRLSSPEKPIASTGRTPTTTSSGETAKPLTISGVNAAMRAPEISERQRASNRKRSATDLVFREGSIDPPQQTSKSMDEMHGLAASAADPSPETETAAGSEHLQILRDLISQTNRAGSSTLTLDIQTACAVASSWDAVNKDLNDRSSQQYIEGLTVAAEVYQREVTARLEAEAEVARLRARVHGHTARMSIVNDEQRRDSLRRQSQDLVINVSNLERDIAKLQVERDMLVAELQELGNLKRSDRTDASAGHVERTLEDRLQGVKQQYARDLEPLIAQRESLGREIADLREARNSYLEEATSLSAKNDELAELNTRLIKQSETLQEAISRQRMAPPIASHLKQHMSASPSLSSITTLTNANIPDQEEGTRLVRRTDAADNSSHARNAGRFKWYKSSKGPDLTLPTSQSSKASLSALTNGKVGRPSHETNTREHVFQQHSILRFSRCEHCGEKMWGLQELKCAACGVFCHAKCAEKLPPSCKPTDTSARDDPVIDLAPSIFGRRLEEQIAADSTPVPVIVTKCIAAVESQGMDYEGIYRKTGGSSLSKQISQLFDRGDYDAFDLADIDRFNDINSITSTLKSYFRSLPNPLLTHELHEKFVSAASLKDPAAKSDALLGLVRQLPPAHLETLKVLMLHLNRVKNHSGENLMTSRNLGVVFGPTLMRSPDPAREFGDMAGKALFVEWCVDHAAEIFTIDHSAGGTPDNAPSVPEKSDNRSSQAFL